MRRSSYVLIAGLLLAFMFVWNMLGALILLPALAHFLLKPARGATNTAGAALQPALA